MIRPVERLKLVSDDDPTCWTLRAIGRVPFSWIVLARTFFTWDLQPCRVSIRNRGLPANRKLALRLAVCSERLLASSAIGLWGRSKSSCSLSGRLFCRRSFPLGGTWSRRPLNGLTDFLFVAHLSYVGFSRVAWGGPPERWGNAGNAW